ncbi:MAG: peptidoglycan editing factor PgeF [Aphanocapsa feldmannii 288cV]|nr:MAG: peptidoglycan editing factor PgeF [Aphanocapsa feldmannii 288cV]
MDSATMPGWHWQRGEEHEYLRCDALGHVRHGFFSRNNGGRQPRQLVHALLDGGSPSGAGRSDVPTVHRSRQIHSSRILSASLATQPWPEVDGLIADGVDQSLWASSADCAPVLLADQRSGRVASCHAGWRGIAAGILSAVVNGLIEQGSASDDLLVALGPAIAGIHYQVERDVAERVAASLGRHGWQALSQEGALGPDSRPGHLRLDIRLAARLQLCRSGVKPDRIHTCPLCTFSDPDHFHSWRRDQHKVVQWSGICSR